MKTAIDSTYALDQLGLIARVIAQDNGMERWFAGLAHKPLVQRRNEIYRISEQLRENGTESALITSFRLLADPSVFNAVSEILKN